MRNCIQGDDDDDENDEGKAHTEHQNVSSLLEVLVPMSHLCPPGNFFSLCYVYLGNHSLLDPSLLDYQPIDHPILTLGLGFPLTLPSFPHIPKRMKETKGAVQSQRRARMETEFLLGADMTSPFLPGFCKKIFFCMSLWITDFFQP